MLSGEGTSMSIYMYHTLQSNQIINPIFRIVFFYLWRVVFIFQVISALLRFCTCSTEMHVLPSDNNCYNDYCQNCQQHGCCHTSCNGHGISIFIYQAVGASKSWKKMKIITSTCIAITSCFYMA